MDELQSRIDNACREALAKWGPSNQLSQTIQECAELILAIQHYQSGRGSLSAVAEEVAGVEIMARQVALICGVVIEEARERQVEKLEGYLARKGERHE